VEAKHPRALELVNEKKVLDEEVEGAFKEALDAFKEEFKV
jgi:hypothetical protein